MAYSDFNLDRVRRDFGLTICENPDLFAGVPLVPESAFLRETLAYNVPLALANLTEKARSELIVMPILLEVRRRTGDTIGLFSGVEFNVDVTRGLNGICDFILSRSQQSVVVTSPILMLVEAKNDNMKTGLGQCVAEMVGAQRFNSQEQERVGSVYGAVTLGNLWKFLKLEGTTITIDPPEYSLSELSKILGILLSIAGG